MLPVVVVVEVACVLLLQMIFDSGHKQWQQAMARYTNIVNNILVNIQVNIDIILT